jgi:3-oxoacyl-[acyl-carrier-protein] synthase II
MPMGKKRIVVTGIGPVTSIGIGKDRFWHNLLKGKPEISLEKVFADGELWDQYYCHKVKQFNIDKYGLDKGIIEDIRTWKNGRENEDLNYVIAAIKLALDDSKLQYSAEKANEMGLVVTHENMNLMPMINLLSETAYTLMRKKNKISKKEFYDKIFTIGFKDAYDAQPFMTLFHVARVFNIHKESLFVCNACASGLYAIETASQMIQSGRMPIAVVAASDNPDAYKHIWFKNLKVYSTDGIIRPFSSDCNGLVFGGGGIAVVMEDYEHAKKRKAPIYAEYLGGGFGLEGWKVTVPNIGGSSYKDTMAEALSRSDVRKNEIDLICPHGVGSSVIDYYESQAITGIFGKYHKNAFLTTFKPYIGHTLGASALMELAIMLLCMKEDTVLPTLNCANMDKRHCLRINDKIQKRKIGVALKTCTAFAGNNASVVFSKPWQ